MNPKKIIIGTVLAFLLIFGIASVGKMWEDVDAGEIVVIQDPVDGELHVYKTSGMQWQGWGKVTHYKKSNTFWFNWVIDGKDTTADRTIPVKWNDGGHANISGSIRYDLPMDDAQMIKLHSTFGSQEVIKARNVTEAESNKAVAVLAVQTAELDKQKLILEGEGEAAKKKLSMQANGALEQKLAAYIETQKYWAEAFSKFQGNLVPTYQSGTQNGGNAMNWMEIMGMKAMKDLNLDLKNTNQ